MSRYYTRAELKKKVEQIWKDQPERFAGYKFIDATGSYSVTFECDRGHVSTKRMQLLKDGRRCYQCHGAVKHNADDIEERILTNWQSNPKFLGYELRRVFFSEQRWRYEYKCAAGHIREVILCGVPGTTLFGCSHTTHPSYQTKPKSEYRQAILDYWNGADKHIWQGYSLVKLGLYTQVTTEIRCAQGHIAKVAPHRILQYKAGCSHRDCTALRRFQRGTNYKYLVYAGKKYKYQGYEDRLLRVLFKRFISDTIDTNAMLSQPISFKYMVDDGIHHYFPDIRVKTPAYQRWYEVKSQFTYDYNGLDDDLRNQNHSNRSGERQLGNQVRHLTRLFGGMT
ncbi:uncharacterized protein LOC119066073 [Bradysia coprophila]|uniref:uncharacterized protein LOC119066073 n=1 Tax=Bradysia coprophila TaxID=38358 RepID=UPI00187DB8BB|nr:uncharacterized protein LOC119066073 [Bradysia coprophila]